MEPNENYLYKLFVTHLPGPKGLRPFEVRRFAAPAYLNYEPLKEKFEHYFPLLKETIYSIHWQDEDEDFIRVTSDKELSHAKQSLDTPSLVKFFAVPASPVIVHENIICDSCGMDPIIGFRYECVECEEYDLCQNCEHRGVHGGHNMRRHVVNRGFQKPPPRVVPPEPSWRAQPPTLKH